MNRECRNCAHALLGGAESDSVHCGNEPMGKPAEFLRVQWKVNPCSNFRPYTEKGEGPLPVGSDPEFKRLWLAVGDLEKRTEHYVDECLRRIKALEEDEGHARASRLLHGSEILKAFDKIRAIEDRLGKLEGKQ